MRLNKARFLCTVILLLAFSSPHILASEPKPRIGLVMKSLANEFFMTMEEGAKEHQRDHKDYELITNGIKNETDIGGQIRMVEQMIAQQVDALVIAPADSKALVAVIHRAVKAGITVVNIDNAFDQKTLDSKGLRIPFVGPNNKKGAKKVGLYLAKHLKKGEKVAIIEGNPTSFNGQQRTQGFLEAMKEGQMTVLPIQSGMWESDKAHRIALALLNEHPDLKAILCGNDSMALGVASAVKAAGRIGKVLIVGFDNISAIQGMLKNRRILATAEQHARKQAAMGIGEAMNILHRKKTLAQGADLIETPVDLVTW